LYKFVCHSYNVVSMAVELGWLPGARYTNLRDVKRFKRLGFLDIDWQNYSFSRHLTAAKSTRPLMTVARDITNSNELESIINEAYELSQYVDKVIIVPKDIHLKNRMPHIIPSDFILGYSVPTRYGGTMLPISCFTREVHILGGHPLKQRSLGNHLHIISLDCNRFTYDAVFGDYFDGETFRPHPIGGYINCIRDSIININRLWEDYDKPLL